MGLFRLSSYIAHFTTGKVSCHLKDTLKDFIPIRSQVSHPNRHNIDGDLLLLGAAGMLPNRMTPVRAQGTGPQHNRSAESSVNGTIVLLGNKAEPEYRRAAHRPGVIGNRVMGWTSVYSSA